ncbi:MAG: ggt [Bradyrhizobium sp.]|nr:ggt [Bradyrhizobium sp.]
MGKLTLGLSRRALLTGAGATALVPQLARAQTSALSGSPEPIISSFARHLPVLAARGMVVSQEVRASAIGVDILKRGGNAVDAAVATGFALAVTLPRAGNIGGGGFMVIHLAQGRRNIAVDYREMASAATNKSVFLDAKGAFVPAKSQSSGLGVGVPGTVAGFALAYEKYGSGRFTFAQLIEPAIALAREGIDVDDDLADSLPGGARRMSRYPSSRAIFMRPDGTPLKRGDRLVQSDLAWSLSQVAQSGPRGFYAGPVAERLSAAVRDAGGEMSLEDLAAYRAVERPVVQGVYRGREIISMPPPSSGGIHVVQILNMLEAFPLREMGHNSAATLHVMAEAMKLAYADRAAWLGDPDFFHVPMAGLVSKAYGEQLGSTISQERARPSSQIRSGNPIPYESDQTTHYSVVDAQGNAVSNTYTLNFSYGLGLVAPGTGILLNNELDDFAARENAPNAFGLLGGEAHAPGPRKRPLSSMSPAMVFRNGELELVTGSPGGSRIINIVLQIILNVLDHRMNAAEATAATRIHHQWMPDELQVENGISIDTLRILEARGHHIRPVRAFGSTQTIHRADGVLMGAADTRQRGTGAVGY